MATSPGARASHLGIAVEARFLSDPAGRPRGAKGKRPRARADSGVVELIRNRRAENAARWWMMQTAIEN